METLPQEAPSSNDAWWQIAGLTLAPIAASLLSWGSWWVVVGALVVWAVTMRPVWAILAICVVIGVRCDAAIGALNPVATRPVDQASVRLVDDPRSTDFGLRISVEFDDARVVATVPFSSVSQVQQLGAGDSMVVSGSARGQRPSGSWAISRRIRGNLTVSEVHETKRAAGAHGVSTAVRGLIRDGARSLTPDNQVLFTGLVFGDDRGQDVVVADNFRAAGLGHLLAVSGQNVVFVLLLASPVLMRVRSLGARTGLALVVLVAFGFLTRFEPSVLRAIVMAGFVVAATNAGRPASARRVLPVAVSVIVLVDPLLAWSLAFQLSVLATLGLVLLTPWILDRVEGPRGVLAAVSATASAQLFVSPLLFASFGTVSAVAVPANLVAGPAAAGVMMWGLVIGPIAGLGPPWLASVLHLPTSAMLWWVREVAAHAARLDVAGFTPWHVGVIVVAVFAASRWRLLAGALLALVAISTFVVPPPLPPGHHQLESGLEVTRSAAGYNVVVLDTSVRVEEAVRDLRQTRLARVDLLVVTDPGRSAGRVAAALRERFVIIEVWAPPNHQTPGARAVEPLAGQIGDLTVAPADGGVHVVAS